MKTCSKNVIKRVHKHTVSQLLGLSGKMKHEKSQSKGRKCYMGLRVWWIKESHKMSSLMEIVWKCMRDNGRPTKLIKETLCIEQQDTAQDLICCLLDYILVTSSRKHVEPGMCTWPSQKDNTEAVEDWPIAENSICKTQVFFLPGQWALPFHLSMWSWPHTVLPLLWGGVLESGIFLKTFDPELSNA